MVREKKGSQVDDRHWNPEVPVRTKTPPKAVQTAYTHCQYEVHVHWPSILMHLIACCCETRSVQDCSCMDKTARKLSVQIF